MGQSEPNYEFVLKEFPELLAVFTNKSSNDLSNYENKTILCGDLGIEIKNLKYMKQIHSNIPKLVNHNAIYPHCDAIITNKKNLPLLVVVADCVPVFLYDKKNYAIACIHSGRVGTFSNIIKETLNLMKKEFNTSPNDVMASLGPSIQSCCYEINTEVLKLAKENFSEFLVNKNLDLHKILISQLKENGVINIENSEICTSCHKKYFSYRANKTKNRQGGIIMLKETNA